MGIAGDYSMLDVGISPPAFWGEPDPDAVASRIIYDFI
jgi:hypothetical protein